MACCRKDQPTPRRYVTGRITAAIMPALKDRPKLIRRYAAG